MSESHPTRKSRVSKIVMIATAAIAIAAGALAYAHQGMSMHGGMSAEMHLDHVQAMLGKIGATDAQKSQIDGILKGAFSEMKGVHEAHSQTLKQVHELLLAPSIDRAKIESLRAEQIKSIDEASKRMVVAFADAAEVLSPEQRAALAEEVRKRHEH